MNDLKDINIPYKTQTKVCSYTLISNKRPYHLNIGRKSTKKEVIYPSAKKSTVSKNEGKIIQKSPPTKKDIPQTITNCVLSGRKFITFEELITLGLEPDKSAKINTAQLFTFTFFIQNLGKNPVEVTLLISPDNKKWLDDGLTVTIEPSDIITLVSNTFAKYTRLALKAINGNSELKIWFQGQV